MTVVTFECDNGHWSSVDNQLGFEMLCAHHRF
jgi:hypothetical protein